MRKINKIVVDKAEKTGETWNKLKTMDCLDICTIIAENVVSGVQEEVQKLYSVWPMMKCNKCKR